MPRAQRQPDLDSSNGPPAGPPTVPLAVPPTVPLSVPLADPSTVPLTAPFADLLGGPLAVPPAGPPAAVPPADVPLVHKSLGRNGFSDRSGLADAIRRIEGGFGRQRPPTRLSTRIAVMDARLPGGGLLAGALHALSSGRQGAGLWTWALWLAAAAAGRGGQVIWLDSGRDFYPPAAWGGGLDARRLLLVRPRRRADVFWVMDQALRCPGVAAVIGMPGRLSPTEARRLQLAAEAGGGVGLLMESRPHTRRALSKMSEATSHASPPPAACPSSLSAGLVPLGLASCWRVHPCAAGGGARGRRFIVELTRCKGASAGWAVALEVDDDANLVALPDEPARRSDAGRREGASRAGPLVHAV